MTLGVLLGAVKRLRPAGGGVSVVCTDPHIRRIFEITLLDRVFTMHSEPTSRLDGAGGGSSSSAASRRRSADTVLVEFPATEGYRSVGRLVLGGLASRFELPVDRVEDLLLAAREPARARASPATR